MAQPTTPSIAGRPSLIVSDVHLGAVPPATEAAFGDFLRHAATHAAELLIAGDLFDVFYTFRHFTPTDHVRTLALLADLVDAGVRVQFVGGNRDANEWGDTVLRRFGVKVLPDPARITLAGRPTLVAHGDGVGRGRREYRKGLRLLRHPIAIWATRHLVPPDWLFGTLSENSGTRVWAARHARGLTTGPKARAPEIEAWALDELAADPTLALVACGHSHLPALREVAPGRHYVNAGDWVSHHTYVEVPAGGGTPRVLCWPSRAPLDWDTVDDGRERVRPPAPLPEDGAVTAERAGAATDGDVSSPAQQPHAPS